MAYKKGFEFITFQSVSHNGVFSHNMQTSTMVHAINEKKAREAMRPLKQAEHKVLDENTDTPFVLDVGPENIYRVVCRGFVRRRIVFDYVDTIGEI